MRSQGTVREWDRMDKKDQGYSRPGTGGVPRTSYGKVGQPSLLFVSQLKCVGRR